MAEISPDDVQQAVSRWRDFVELQPIDEEATAKLQEQLNAGETAAAAATFASLREGMSDGPRAELVADRLVAVSESVGLGSSAQSAFAVGMSELLAEQVWFSEKDAADTSAFIGLVVGLMARQLADERGD